MIQNKEAMAEDTAGICFTVQAIWEPRASQLWDLSQHWYRGIVVCYIHSTFSHTAHHTQAPHSTSWCPSGSWCCDDCGKHTTLGIPQPSSISDVQNGILRIRKTTFPSYGCHWCWGVWIQKNQVYTMDTDHQNCRKWQTDESELTALTCGRRTLNGSRDVRSKQMISTSSSVHAFCSKPMEKKVEHQSTLSILSIRGTFLVHVLLRHTHDFQSWKAVIQNCERKGAAMLIATVLAPDAA